MTKSMILSFINIWKMCELKNTVSATDNKQTKYVLKYNNNIMFDETAINSLSKLRTYTR